MRYVCVYVSQHMTHLSSLGMGSNIIVETTWLAYQAYTAGFDVGPVFGYTAADVTDANLIYVA